LVCLQRLQVMSYWLCCCVVGIQTSYPYDVFVFFRAQRDICVIMWVLFYLPYDLGVGTTYSVYRWQLTFLRKICIFRDKFWILWNQPTECGHSPTEAVVRFRSVPCKSKFAPVGTEYRYGETYVYTQGRTVAVQTPNTLEPDRQQHYRPAACVIAQQYSFTPFFSVHFQSSGRKGGGDWWTFRMCYFFKFLFYCCKNCVIRGVALRSGTIHKTTIWVHCREFRILSQIVLFSVYRTSVIFKRGGRT